MLKRIWGVLFLMMIAVQSNIIPLPRPWDGGGLF